MKEISFTFPANITLSLVYEGDEATIEGLPSMDAWFARLRVQQLLAAEAIVANIADNLAGDPSSLTSEQARHKLAVIRALVGVR